MKSTFFRFYLSFILLGLVTTISGQSNGELRLSRDGVVSRTYTSGRLQIYLNGQWGNICDNGFNMVAADVSCHQLGYDRALGYSSAANDSFGFDDRPPLLNDITCNNNNFLHILQCGYSTTVNCESDDEVSITCSTTPVWTNPFQGALRLQAGTYPSRGRLEIYIPDDWDTLCDNGFGSNEAHTACRQLGYTHASQWNHISGIQGSHGRTTQYTCCYRSNNCLRDCYCDDDDKKRRKRIDLFCDHNDDVTLQCDFSVSSKNDAGTRYECDFTHRDKIIGIVIGSVCGGICCIIIIVFLGCLGFAKFNNWRNS